MQTYQFQQKAGEKRMLTYQLLSPEQVADIFHTHMQQDFPPAEVKPLAVLHDLMRRGVYAPYGWFDETGALTAYTFFVKAPQGEILLLDYFAVCSSYRSHGYGSQCLAQMMTLHQGTKGILAEVEDPTKSNSAEEEKIRTRRVAFYQRNGLRQTTVRSVLFGVPYVMHYYPLAADCDDKQLQQELEAIYHTLFPQKVYEAHAKIWRVESGAQ